MLPGRLLGIGFKYAPSIAGMVLWPSDLSKRSTPDADERATLDKVFYDRNRAKNMPTADNRVLRGAAYFGDKSWRLHFEVGAREFSVRYDSRGRPDFSPYLFKGPGAEVFIPVGKSRGVDERAANRAGGFVDGIPEGYTWHHAELLTIGGGSSYKMQLVQEDVHDAARHAGAVSEAKKQK